MVWLAWTLAAVSVVATIAYSVWTSRHEPGVGDDED